MPSVNSMKESGNIFLSYGGNNSSSAASQHDSGFKALNRVLTDSQDSIYDALKKVSELAANSLKVDRVGIWSYQSTEKCIYCENLYTTSEKTHTNGFVLSEKDYPKYFDVINKKKFIAVSNADSHEDTQEFQDYLIENGIKSLLDCRITVGKKIGGVVCFEQTKYVRQWTFSDQMFANAVGDTVALLWEAHERKERENILHQRDEELQVMSEEMDQFVYTLSHDIRAPITSVMGLIDLIRYEEPNESVTRYLDLQELSLKRLDDFIVSTSTMLKSKDIGVHIQPLRINSLVSKALRLIELEPNRDQVDINLKTSQDREFYTDERKLTSIVQNLVIKAVQYCDLRKKISYLNITGHVEDGSCTIQFEDNGYGLSKEKLQQISDMLKTKKSNPILLGLNLSIVKNQLESLQGTIEINSVQNVGTTVTLKVPNLLD